MYFAVKKNRITDFKGLFKKMTAAGVMYKNIPDDDFNAAFNNVWALSEFIIQSMYMNNEKITETNMKRCFIRIMYILKPFFCEESREELFPG